MKQRKKSCTVPYR